MRDTTILEEEIEKFKTMRDERIKQVSFLTRQIKEDDKIIKQMEKSLASLKEDADQPHK